MPLKTEELPEQDIFYLKNIFMLKWPVDVWTAQLTDAAEYTDCVSAEG